MPGQCGFCLLGETHRPLFKSQIRNTKFQIKSEIRNLKSEILQRPTEESNLVRQLRRLPCFRHTRRASALFAPESAWSDSNRRSPDFTAGGFPRFPARLCTQFPPGTRDLLSSAVDLDADAEKWFAKDSGNFMDGSPIR